MPPRLALTPRILALAALLTAMPARPQLPTFAPGMARSEGVDSSGGIRYMRLFLAARPPGTPPSKTPPPPPTPLDLSEPVLTAQCSLRPSGKYIFEMFVNFGGVTDTAFYPPWKPTPTDVYPPSTIKVNLTLEFLGYTTVKPVKRQFEYAVSPAGQLRYNPPSTSSANLVDMPYEFQYLRVLPTLRISGEGHVAEFFMTDLLAQLHREPLCKVSGI